MGRTSDRTVHDGGGPALAPRAVVGSLGSGAHDPSVSRRSSHTTLPGSPPGLPNHAGSRGARGPRRHPTVAGGPCRPDSRGHRSGGQIPVKGAWKAGGHPDPGGGPGGPAVGGGPTPYAAGGPAGGADEAGPFPRRAMSKPATKAAIATTTTTTIHVQGKLEVEDAGVWNGGCVDPLVCPVTVTLAVAFAITPTPSVAVT
jgi:hypothetical protein